MRRSPLLLVLALTACSSNPGTAGLPSPSPLLPTVAQPASPRSTGLSTPTMPAAHPSRVVLPGARPSRTHKASPSPRPARTWVLSITGFAFDPATLAIRVGDSVRITNDDPDTHTFTARNGSFDSGDLAQGRSVTLRFTKVGVFDVVCSHHASMTGQLSVSA